MDPVQQFKTLSRYYGDPIYAGESEFISRVMQQFDGLSLKELTRLVDSNREKLALPWELRREWRLRKLSPDLKEKHYAEYAAKRMEDGRNHVELLRSVLNCLGFADYGKPMRILELGSGRGSFIAMAQQEPLCKTWHFEGVDMDMASLLINLKFNEELGNRKYKLICCYGEKLPFDDNRFDIIASFARGTGMRAAQSMPSSGRVPALLCPPEDGPAGRRARDAQGSAPPPPAPCGRGRARVGPGRGRLPRVWRIARSMSQRAGLVGVPMLRDSELAGGAAEGIDGLRQALGAVA